MIDMTKYRLELMKYNGNKTEAVAKVEGFKEARAKAVKTLTKIDKKGMIIVISTDKKYMGIVSMQTGPDDHVKPSVGLKNGLQFMYDDGDVFYTCFKNGDIKRW